LKEIEHGLFLEGYKHHGRSFRPYAAGHLLRGTGDSESVADLEKATNPDLRSGASVLHHNLEEEKAADQKLTQIAEAKVNLEAAQ
jgi:hypothetical protein